MRFLSAVGYNFRLILKWLKLFVAILQQFRNWPLYAKNRLNPVLNGRLNIPVAGTGKVVLKDGSVVKANGSLGKGATNTLLLGVDPSTITTLNSIYSDSNSEKTLLQKLLRYGCQSGGQLGAGVQWRCRNRG